MMGNGPNDAINSTIDPSELEKFAAIAEEWWDPTGKFRPLHKFNPTRLTYIRDHAVNHFGRDSGFATPLDGLRILDIGCGGGLVAEPLRRLGANVTAIDAAERNIKAAQAHADKMHLDIDYRATSVEALVAESFAPVDIVLNLEVVEHVADVDLFLNASASLVKPGGMMFVATINKTLKALALAKIGAEYILRWLPIGTHDPAKFVTPAQIQSAFDHADMTVIDRTGVSYNPIADKWSMSSDLAVNYMMVAKKAAN